MVRHSLLGRQLVMGWLGLVMVHTVKIFPHSFHTLRILRLGLGHAVRVMVRHVVKLFNLVYQLTCSSIFIGHFIRSFHWLNWTNLQNSWTFGAALTVGSKIFESNFELSLYGAHNLDGQSL